MIGRDIVKLASNLFTGAWVIISRLSIGLFGSLELSGDDLLTGVLLSSRCDCDVLYHVGGLFFRRTTLSMDSCSRDCLVLFSFTVQQSLGGTKLPCCATCFFRRGSLR